MFAGRGTTLRATVHEHAGHGPPRGARLRRMSVRISRVAAVLGVSTSLAAQGQPYVRVHDDVIQVLPAPALPPPPPPSTLAASLAPCATLPVAWHGQPVPGGGTLSPIAPGNPACVNRDGAFAFVSSVNGAARNQGVFV